VDYSRGLIKQLDELTLENGILRKENQWLRSENKRLTKRVETLEASIDSRIEKALSEALEKKLSPLKTEIAEKDVKISKLNNEILRLKSVTDKDSGNSSKPPSSNGFKKIMNSREKSSLKTGGQIGHKAHILQLPENLNELIEKGYAEKRLLDFTNGCSEYVSKYEIDIEIKAIYTEYRFPANKVFQKKFCSNVFYGNKLKSLAVMLSNEGIIACKRLGMLFNNMTGGALKISESALFKYISQFSEKLQPEIDAIKTSLLNGKVLHVDETPMRCYQTLIYDAQTTDKIELKSASHTTFNATVRNYSNETATLYTANSKKDVLGVERDKLLPVFCGTLSHDHDSKYYKYGTSHATCGAHLMRELRALSELYLCNWASKMSAFFSELNQYKKESIANGETFCPQRQFEIYLKEYNRLLSDGECILSGKSQNEFGRNELRKMLNRLKKHRDSYLMFLRDYTSPFTNNLSERDLRPCKTKQKVSGCFRSWTGLLNYTKIRSFISTLKKRSLEILNSIFLVFNGQPVLS
jgi:hypothetical protein